MFRKQDKLDTDTYRALIKQFLAVYAWQYAYCNGSWWRWDVDEAHWDPMGVVQHLGNVFVIIARDLYPKVVKIQHQAGMDYIIKGWMKDLRPYLLTATLPCPPRPGSRVPSSQ